MYKTPLTFFVIFSLMPLSIVFGEIVTDEILNVSVKINDQTKSLPLKIAGAEPLFVKIEQDDANGFVEISVYLATEAKKTFTVSSDLKDFFVTADGAKTILSGKDRVSFEAQDSRVQIFAYGQVPRKSLFTMMKVVGNSDLLNVLARSNTSSESDDEDASQMQSKSSANPLANPVLKKLDGVISNSTLPNKDHYTLLMQDLEKTYKQGKQDESIAQALATIDEINEKENLFAQNKRECERSRLKILEVEDLISKTDAPEKASEDAKKELEHAKSYQESFLCDEALASAKKAEQAIQLDPLEWVGMEYPWLLPGSVIVAICFGAFVMVQKYRSENSGVGLK